MDYNLNKDNQMNKVEKLTQFLLDQAQWYENYQEHEDNIASYAECLELNDIYYGEIDDDIREEVKQILENMDKSDIWDYCEVVYTHGFHCASNEIDSISIGEIECQFTGLYNNKTESNCVYSDLIKDMTESEIETAKNESGLCIHNDYIYLDYSYDRISLILDVDKLLEKTT